MKNTTSTQVKINNIAKFSGWIMVGTVMILYLSPGHIVNKFPSFPHADKLVHLSNFLFMGTAFKLGYPKTGYKKIALGLMSFGLLLEILQGWLPIGRTFDWFDFIADASGVTLAIPTLRILHKNFSKHLIDATRHD